MSIHKSLAIKSGGVQHRNVLTRPERIAKLIEDEKWEDEKSPYGIPKVRNIKPKKKAKAPTADEAAAEGAEGVEAAAGTEGAPAKDDAAKTEKK